VKNDTKKNLKLPQNLNQKFIIRKDLTPTRRFEIAFKAYQIQQMVNSYGEMTKLAIQYKICRAFLYILLNILMSNISQIFSPQEQEKKITKKELISRMLLHRMVGKNSIESISEIMNYDQLKNSSVGSISQSLSAIGALLPTVQSIPVDKVVEITATSDEIFIGNRPILITLEPKSLTILSIELAKSRDESTWSEHFTKIELAGEIEIINIVTDGGSGLCSAISDRGILWQPDTYHAIAHRLGKWVHKLEQRAYKRIAIEYERKRVLASAKSKKVINKRRYKYNKAREETLKVIEIYDNFLYLYSSIIKELQPFKSSGELRDREIAKENIEVALELIESINDEHINKQVATIKNILPELLNYFEEAKKSIKKCKRLGIDDDIITTLTLAWQWNKRLIKVKKDKRRREKAKSERLFYLEYAKAILGDEYKKTKEMLFDELDNIIQSSSMVENINSILRPYLNNSKNQITQEFLNLFAFYHNHRRFKEGKRKGKTPMELITGKEQDKDWIELLTDFIEKVEPSFFL